MKNSKIALFAITISLFIQGCIDEAVDPKIVVDKVEAITDQNLCSIVYFTNRLRVYKIRYNDGPTTWIKAKRNAVIISHKSDATVFNGDRKSINKITNEVKKETIGFGSTFSISIPYGDAIEPANIQNAYYAHSLVYSVDLENNYQYEYKNNYLSPTGDGNCGYVYFYTLLDNQNKIRDNLFEKKSGGGGAIEVDVVQPEIQMRSLNVEKLSNGIESKERTLARISDFMNHEGNQILDEMVHSYEAKLATGIETVSPESARSLIQRTAREKIEREVGKKLSDLDTKEFVNLLVNQI